MTVKIPVGVYSKGNQRGKPKFFYKYCGEVWDIEFRIKFENKVKISRKTFLRNVEGETLKLITKLLGYSLHYKQGETMASDTGAQYFRCTYQRRETIVVVAKGKYLYWARN